MVETDSESMPVLGLDANFKYDAIAGTAQQTVTVSSYKTQETRLVRALPPVTTCQQPDNSCRLGHLSMVQYLLRPAGLSRLPAVLLGDDEQ